MEEKKQNTIDLPVKSKKKVIDNRLIKERKKTFNNNLSNGERSIEEEPKPTNFTSILYDGIVNAVGNNNPYQMFALNWPATVLDEGALDWDANETDYVMPADVRALTSQLLDMYIPPSPITQTDGSRVSDRYMSTINGLGPIPNSELINLQKIIRDKLQQTIVINENGEDVEVTVTQWFDRLYSKYLSAKKSWDKAQTEERARIESQYPNQPDKQNNAYLEWYNINARSFLNEINEAHQNLLAEFPLREWEAAISILDTSNDQDLMRAKGQIRDFRIPIPIEYGGGEYAPSTAVPLTWSTDLKTKVGKLDMLSTPAARFQDISTSVRALQSEIQAWSAIMPDITDEETKNRLAEFKTALNTFALERTTLAQNWGESVYVVVEAVAAYTTSFSTTTEKFVSAMTKTAVGDQDLTQNLANAIHSSYGLGAGEATYARVTEFTEKIVNQQNGVWEQQDKALNAGSTLAGAATAWLESQGRQTNLKWIFSYIEQLKIRLDNLRQVQAQLLQSSMVMWKKMFDPDVENQDEIKGAYVPLTENAISQNNDGAMTPRSDYDKLNEPDAYASNNPDTWTEILMTLEKGQMESTERMSTTFTKREWGANFFFGSYGSQQQSQTSDFANEFMSEDSKIQIGMLVKKVNMRRNWMDPSILQKSSNYFRSGNTRFTANSDITTKKILENEDLQAELQKTTLPCYPVSLLIAKDVSIKMNFDFSLTERVKQFASSTASAGGGFFLFNSSSVDSSSDSSESVSVNTETGELVVKFKSPQVIGYYLALSPPDESQELTQPLAEEIANAISFLNSVKEVHNV
ncbi:hypothetical protein [Aquimarina sp. AU474]|uniref:hypothetical protein n=1 Tax=Aquimarina sp. AU474 TaxID=2108529 RepID=UPI000D69EE24|nr:hypothetical protein [Aquimarina sp. AU474]